MYLLHDQEQDLLSAQVGEEGCFGLLVSQLVVSYFTCRTVVIQSKVQECLSLANGLPQHRCELLFLSPSEILLFVLLLWLISSGWQWVVGKQLQRQ